MSYNFAHSLWICNNPGMVSAGRRPKLVTIHFKFVVAGNTAEHIVIIQDQNFGIGLRFQVGIGCSTTRKPGTYNDEVKFFPGILCIPDAITEVIITQRVRGVYHFMGVPIGDINTGEKKREQ